MFYLAFGLLVIKYFDICVDDQKKFIYHICCYHDVVNVTAMLKFR